MTQKIHIILNNNIKQCAYLSIKMMKKVHCKQRNQMPSNSPPHNHKEKSYEIFATYCIFEQHKAQGNLPRLARAFAAHMPKVWM